MQTLDYIGACLYKLGDTVGAITYHKKSLNIAPSNPESHNYLAMCLLLTGNYKDGLVHHEYRLKLKNSRSFLVAQPSCPEWKGESISKSNLLIVVCEQGIGETLLFVRFVFELINQGYQVNIVPHPKLSGLLKESGLKEHIQETECIETQKDVTWIAIASLLKYLNISPGRKTLMKRYLYPGPKNIQKAKIHIPASKKIRIGINWCGNRADKNKQSRNFCLLDFTKISHLDNVEFISLQRGKFQADIEQCSFRDKFISSQEHINELANSESSEDFSNTLLL